MKIRQTKALGTKRVSFKVWVHVARVMMMSPMLIAEMEEPPTPQIEWGGMVLKLEKSFITVWRNVNSGASIMVKGAISKGNGSSHV